MATCVVLTLCTLCSLITTALRLRALQQMLYGGNAEPRLRFPVLVQSGREVFFGGVRAAPAARQGVTAPDVEREAHAHGDVSGLAELEEW